MGRICCYIGLEIAVAWHAAARTGKEKISLMRLK